MTKVLRPHSEAISVRAGQLARLLNISTKTVRNWTLERGLPHRRIGRIPLYIVEEVNDWLRTQSRAD